MSKLVEINRMSVKDLRTQLKSKNLTCSGTRKELVIRLLEKPGKPLEAQTLECLRAMCTARGLTIRGGKPQLLARLQGGPTTQGFGSLSTPQLRQKLIATGVPLKGIGQLHRMELVLRLMEAQAQGCASSAGVPGKILGGEKKKTSVEEEATTEEDSDEEGVDGDSKEEDDNENDL